MSKSLIALITVFKALSLHPKKRFMPKLDARQKNNRNINKKNNSWRIVLAVAAAIILMIWLLLESRSKEENKAKPADFNSVSTVERLSTSKEDKLQCSFFDTMIFFTS